jgi:dTDP-4-amino-4,6-dideoxygalactose transaminase
MIPFNKIHLTGNESVYMTDALQCGKISGDGPYTRACQAFIEKRYGFKQTFITTSCTHAIEMATLLMDIKPGDEVIIPSFTFVSSATPFILRGAKIIFADSDASSPNMNIEQVKSLITPLTKAILAIHYGGIPCAIAELRTLADEHQLFLIEDAAQAIDAYYQEKPVGSFGHLSMFSFHETKNVTCGEGGMLIVNDENLILRAEILREKGTNRSSFARGEVAKYTWVDIGSSYIPSDILAAFLLAQLEQLDTIQQRRLNLWQQYYNAFISLHNSKLIALPYIASGIKHNAHTFYFMCASEDIRASYITYMADNGVQVQFHYMPLHDSPFYKAHHGDRELPMADGYRNCLVRLPLFLDLSSLEINKIIALTLRFFDTPN